VIGIHRRQGLEGPESIQGQDENDFTNRQDDKLGDAGRLNCADGDAANEGKEDGDEGKGSCLIRIGIVQRTVER
jgi:hypothetical protein